jgi:lysophospholipase L1-like esterase
MTGSGLIQNMKSRKIVFVFLAILFSAVISYLLLALFLNLNNNLKTNGRWLTTKASMAKHLSLTYAFFTQSPALSHNRLNLGAWNGYNEVIYKDPLDLAEIEFKAFFPKDSYVVIIFNKTPEGFEGIRLGPYYLYRNIYFKADKDGEFKFVQNLSPVHVRDNKWRDIRISSDGKKLEIFINEKPVYTVNTAFKPGASAGFRGGQHDVWIDSVALKTQDQRVIHEDFSPGISNGCKILFLIILIACLLFFLQPVRSPEITNNAFFSLVIWNVFFIVFLAVVNLFYFYIMAPRYPALEGRLKQKEEYWIDAEEKRIKEGVEKLYAPADPQKYRILFLGSSQTWGAGVAKDEDIFVSRLQRKFDQNPLMSGKVELINGAISGTNAKRLFAIYKSEFYKLNPDMVVINLSNNDNVYDEREFQRYLERFVKFDRKAGIKTVFVLEPNSIEHRYLLPMHGPMMDVAAENNVPVLDLNDYLRQRYDSGFIWWDSVHMTSYGHKLAAEFLYEEIKKAASQ